MNPEESTAILCDHVHGTMKAAYFKAQDPYHVAEGGPNVFHLCRPFEEEALCGETDLNMSCGKPFAVWGRQPPPVPRKHVSYCFVCSQEAQS